jgi:TatD DNase family protein
MLETDAPYLTPVPFRGKRNESSYLHYVAEKLMNIYQKDMEEIGEITTVNAMNLYSI